MPPLSALRLDWFDNTDARVWWTVLHRLCVDLQPRESFEQLDAVYCRPGGRRQRYADFRWCA